MCMSKRSKDGEHFLISNQHDDLLRTTSKNDEFGSDI